MLENISSVLITEGTLWSLGVFSVTTWTLIVIKSAQHWRVASQNRKHIKQFWAASDFNAAAQLSKESGPIARLAHSGFNALRDADGGSATHDLEHSGSRQELLERYLRQQVLRERRALDGGLAVLASIGSTAPFVGLFGTVFGIIHALTGISKAGSASLDVVAGPIGEALVATGIGIAVAVPAVLAYNFFVRRAKLVNGDLDDFASNFITLAQKSAFRIKRQPAGNTTSSGTNEVNPVLAKEVLV